MKKIGILMIHGFTACPKQFRDLEKFFSDKGFIVSTPLIAGHGASPKELEKTNIEDWKNSVKKAYLDLKSQVDKIFIIGNSFGGNLALWLAREFDNEQAGIITLSTPIFLKYHNFILLRINTYGLFRKYYKKPRRVYKNFISFLKSFLARSSQEVNGAVTLRNDSAEIIPIKSLRYFLNFIKNETRPNLSKITTPIFITHALFDTVVEPKSAQFIYNKTGSKNKTLFWFESNRHVVMNDEKKEKLFEKIYNFIKEQL